MPKSKKSKKRFGGRDITPGTKDRGDGSDASMARLYGGDGGPEPAAMAKARKKKHFERSIQGMYSPNRPRR